MQKIIYTLLVIGAFAAAASAQEQAVYSQYQVYPILINPGVTGFGDEHQFLVNARRTWAGFPGTPTTFTFMYNGPVGDKLALGGGLFSEKIGSINTVRLQGNYAFRFRIQKTQIGLGLSTEFLRRQANSNLLGNPIVDPRDAVLEDIVSNQQIFDASLGAHVLYDNRLFVGLALPNAIRARLDQVQLPGEENSGLFQHYVFQLGYVINAQAQGFKVIPSLALRNVRDVPYQIDLNVQGRFIEDKLIAGLTFRPSTGGSMAFMIGSKYNSMQLLYSYDVSFGPFQQYTGGSHEISLSYALARKKKPGTEPSEQSYK